MDPRRFGEVATPTVTNDLVNARIPERDGENFGGHWCVEDCRNVRQNLISARSSGRKNSSR